MSLQWAGGAELQKYLTTHLFEWSYQLGTDEDTAQKKSGAASWYHIGPNQYCLWNPGSGTWDDEVWVKFDIRVTTGTTDRKAYICNLYGTDDSERRRLWVAFASLGTAWTWYIDDQNGSLIAGSASLTYTVGDWYRVEWYYKREPTSGNSTDQMKLDGTLRISGSGPTDTTQIRYHGFDARDPDSKEGTNIEYHFDDVIVFDGAGSANNTWPGEKQLEFALPIGDVTGYTDWKTLGGGTGSYTEWDEWPTDSNTTCNRADAVNENQLSDYQDHSALGLNSYDNVHAALLRSAHMLTDARITVRYLAREGSGSTSNGPADLEEQTAPGASSLDLWCMDTTPVSSSAWTMTLWDAMEFGATCTSYTGPVDYGVTSMGCYVVWSAGTPPAGQIKKLSGVDWANVKKASGVAEASISDVSGVSAN